MVCRIWHGYTAFGNADAYEKLLKEEIFVHIRNRQIKGFKGIQLLKRPRKLLVRFDKRSSHYEVLTHDM